MRLAENYNLQNPNVCTICEERPTGDSVIDCERYTPNNFRYRLNGRKYICANCAHEVAKKLGYVSNKEIEEVQGLLAIVTTDVKQLQEVNAAQATLLTAVYGPNPPSVEEVPETPPVRKAGRPRKEPVSVEVAE